MVRIHATGSMIGVAFTHLFEKFGWNRVVMLTSVTYCDMGARGISNEFNKRVLRMLIFSHKFIFMDSRKLGNYIYGFKYEFH